MASLEVYGIADAWHAFAPGGRRELRPEWWATNTIALAGPTGAAKSLACREEPLKGAGKAFSDRLELRDPPLPRTSTALRRPQTGWRPRN